MNAIIYPYNIDVAQIYRKMHLIEDLNIVACITLRGYVKEGADLSEVDEAATTGTKVINDFRRSLSLYKYDTVIWAEWNSYLEGIDTIKYKKSIFENIEYAMENGKNIICLEKLSKSEYNKFLCIARDYHVSFICYSQNKKVPNYNKFIRISDVPVIGVVGLNENCLKFNSQLILREEFIKKGYKVSQIGTKHYCELFGFHSFPYFIMEEKIDIKSKILALRNMIANILQKETPDILILGVPRGVLNTSNSIIDNYGVILYLITCAIKFDFTILNIPCKSINNNMVVELENLFRYKYGLSLDAFMVSNISIDELCDSRKYYNSYEVLSTNFVQKCMAESHISKPLFNLFDPTTEKNIVAMIEHTLSDNLFEI